MAKGQSNVSSSSQEQRKKNFFTSMRNNPEVKRRFGGDLNKAYAAMQREAGRQGKGNRSDNQAAIRNAASRRMSTNSRQEPKAAWKPMSLSDAAGPAKAAWNAAKKVGSLTPAAQGARAAAKAVGPAKSLAKTGQRNAQVIYAQTPKAKRDARIKAKKQEY